MKKSKLGDIPGMGNPEEDEAFLRGIDPDYQKFPVGRPAGLAGEDDEEKEGNDDEEVDPDILEVQSQITRKGRGKPGKRDTSGDAMDDWDDGIEREEDDLEFDPLDFPEEDE